MKLCKNCYTDIPDDATVCPKCGRPVARPAAEGGSPAAEPAPVRAAAPQSAPRTTERLQLKTNRGFWKFFLLSLITFGIYGIVVMTNISDEINYVASKRDGKHTMNYLLVLFVFSWLTLGIVPLVWCHRISNRIGNELTARNLDYSFSARTFWGWGVLGILIVVGPLVYTAKMLKAMNQINADYNTMGR